MWTDTIRENQNIQNKILTLFGTQVWENTILRRYGVISTDLTLWQNEFTKISQTYYYFKIIVVKMFEHSCEKLRFFLPLPSRLFWWFKTTLLPVQVKGLAVCRFELGHSKDDRNTCGFSGFHLAVYLSELYPTWTKPVSRWEPIRCPECGAGSPLAVNEPRVADLGQGFFGNREVAKNYPISPREQGLFFKSHVYSWVHSLRVQVPRSHAGAGKEEEARTERTPGKGFPASVCWFRYQAPRRQERNERTVNNEGIALGFQPYVGACGSWNGKAQHP